MRQEAYFKRQMEKNCLARPPLRIDSGASWSTSQSSQPPGSPAQPGPILSPAQPSLAAGLAWRSPGEPGPLEIEKALE